jgi:hypothetical protein
MEQVRLRQQYERNKERYDEARARDRSTSGWRKAFLATALAVGSAAGGAGLEAVTSVVKTAAHPALEKVGCYVSDRFPSRATIPGRFTVVVLPVEKDDRDETSRNKIMASFSSTYDARIIAPCENLKITYPGYSEDVKNIAKARVQYLFDHYSADLVVMGLVENGRVGVKTLARTDDPAETQFLSFEKSDVESTALYTGQVAINSVSSLLREFTCRGIYLPLTSCTRDKTLTGAFLNSVIPKIVKVSGIVEGDIRGRLSALREQKRAAVGADRVFYDFGTPSHVSQDSLQALLLESLRLSLDIVLSKEQSQTPGPDGELDLLYDFANRSIDLARDLSIDDSELATLDIIEGAFDQLLGATCDSVPDFVDSRKNLKAGIDGLEAEDAGPTSDETQYKWHSTVLRDSHVARENARKAANDARKQIAIASAKIWLAHADAFLLAHEKSETQKDGDRKEFLDINTQLQKLEFGKAAALLRMHDDRLTAMVGQFNSDLKVLGIVAGQVTSSLPPDLLSMLPRPNEKMCPDRGTASAAASRRTSPSRPVEDISIELESPKVP